jgi:hypothetical protein
MPLETPDNTGYMIAAYIVAPVILVGYLGSLWGRVRRTGGRADGRTGGRTVGRSDGRTVGRSDGRTVGRSDGQTSDSGGTGEG